MDPIYSGKCKSCQQSFMTRFAWATDRCRECAQQALSRQPRTREECNAALAHTLAPQRCA